MRVSRNMLGGFWARVGVKEGLPKRIRKSMFRVSKRLNDSTNIANPSSSHFERDDASSLDKLHELCTPLPG